MVFGVKAVNGVGSSVTNNSSLVPSTSSTARLLRLTISIPLAPTTLVLTELNTTASIVNVSKYIGASTVLKLTTSTSLLANFYSWELPLGVNRTDVNGVPVIGLTSTTPFIYVTFSEVEVNSSATITLFLGVKAINNVGESVSVNSAPNASNTAKLLRVTAGLPNGVALVTGALSVCDRIEGYDYSFVAPIGANFYTITAPVGSIVTSAAFPSNTSNVLTTPDLNFNVVYTGTALFVSNDRSLIIESRNAFGISTARRILILTKISCPISPKQFTSTSAALNVNVYPNPYTSAFQLDIDTTSQSELEIKVYDMVGKLLEVRKVSITESTNQEIGSSYPSGIYNVIVTQGANMKTLRVIKR
jgi:hypothetical protein